jgi:Mono-functional DNA-alkylating methyl methanesulfonate N-term
LIILGLTTGIKGIWSLKASSMDAFDTYLVLTFVGETRVLAITADDELDEAELSGFDAEAQVHCQTPEAGSLAWLVPMSASHIRELNPEDIPLGRTT